jgi:hypothetical protein
MRRRREQSALKTPLTTVVDERIYDAIEALFVVCAQHSLNPSIVCVPPHTIRFDSVELGCAKREILCIIDWRR